MSSQPYYPPYDQSASSQGSQSSRSNYPQPVYNQYNQPSYGHMGYADMSQSGQRYSQLQYPTDSTEGNQYMNHDGYIAPSFSPTAATFAQSHSYGSAAPDAAMTYRRRYQSTSAVVSTEPRHPMPRHPSGELSMAPMQEGREFVPVPSQPFHEPNAPVARPAASARSSNVGQSSTTSALALEKPYVCDICQTRFARHHDCRRHRETHVVNASGEKPHHCVVCGKSFTRKDALKRHTNQKGCDINAASANAPARSSRSSSSASPQQAPATFYPVSGLPHGSGSGQYY